MKVFWKEPQRVLQMEAESAAELNVIGELLHGGPLAGATWLRVPEDQLPFSRQPGDGITSLIGGTAVVTGLLWDVQARPAEAVNDLRAQEVVALDAMAALKKQAAGRAINPLVAELLEAESSLLALRSKQIADRPST